MLSLTLFGAPAIAWHDQPFQLPRRQARALLYYLAAGGLIVPRQRLHFLFWPDLPDAKARRNLTRLLSYLRRTLPQEALFHTTSHGLGLATEGVTVDARAFTTLCDGNETADLARAVDLYRGPFLDGFSLGESVEFDLWLSGRQRHYERRYLDALGNLSLAHEAAGHLDAAIAYAQRYLAVDALAEEVHRRLITLYATAGDRAAAQRQYEQCVADLERELGVSPLPETRAAYELAMHTAAHATVSGAPTPEVKPVWTTLPTLDLPLIGREQAWQQMEGTYGSLKEGGMIFIAGEPGIGKSRLLQEFATAHEDRWVLAGHCQETTGDLPYRPLLQALRQALGQPARWSAIPRIWLAEAARLLPELTTHFPNLPAPLNLDSQQAQARLFEAISQIFLALALQQPLLLCLDDLHWADEGTLGWLHTLPARLPGSNLCLLATYRSHEAQSLHGLHETLRRSGLRAVISLSGLSPAAVTAILRQLPANVPGSDALAAQIHSATAGNPFFTLETIRTLWESGRLADPPQSLPLPATVQEAVRSRLNRLTPIARQTLDAAAVLAPSLDFAALQATAGRSEVELLDGLDELIAHQLLLEEPAGLRFHHDLARAVVYEALSHWRRRRLHRRAALVLIARHRRDPGRVAAQAAHHYDAAGEVALAGEWYGHAATVAQRQYAHQEALDLLRRALSLLERIPEDRPLATRLHESLGDSLVVAGNFQEAYRAYHAALALGPDDDRLRRVRLYQKVLQISAHVERLREADAVYRQALDALGPDPGKLAAKRWWQTWLDLQLSRFETLYYQGRSEEMETLVLQFEPALEQFGRPDQQFDYLIRQGMLSLRQKRYKLSPQDLASSLKAAELAETINDELKRVYNGFSLGFRYLWAGQRDQGTAHLQRTLAKAESLAYLPLQNQCLSYLTIAARLAGDVPLARSYQARSAKVAQQVGTPYYVGAAEANRAWLHYRDGQWDQATVVARRALEKCQTTVYPLLWLAHWPLLAIALAREDSSTAIDSAAAMLDPAQQQLPDDLTSALQGAVDRWRAGEHNGVRPMLYKALELAKAAHYL